MLLSKTNHQIKKIFLDMDGVFIDFETTFNKLSPKPLSYYSEVAELKPEFDALKRKLIIEESLFQKAELLPDAMTLINEIKDLCSFYNIDLGILTAIGYYAEQESLKQKKLCLIEKKLDNIEFNYVIRSHEKGSFANLNTLLIDDRKKSLLPFIEAGGQGILHKNAVDTLKILKNVLFNQNKKQ